MNKIIFIHGYNSSPTKKKYQFIAHKLKELGIDYAIPAMPGNENPHSKEWLEIIDKEVIYSDKPVVLVGHSLGTRAILLYLDKFNKKVDTAILIATFNNDFENNRKRKDEHYADFFDYALDIEKIKKLANKFIIVHSKDDDSIDYQQALDISKELNAELITHENTGHFCGEENAEKNAKIFLEVARLVL